MFKDIIVWTWQVCYLLVGITWESLCPRDVIGFKPLHRHQWVSVETLKMGSAGICDICRCTKCDEYTITQRPITIKLVTTKFEI